MTFFRPPIGKSKFYDLQQEGYIAPVEAVSGRYLDHPVLGARLTECCVALLALDCNSATEILGFPDDLKLRSSATLFSAISPPDSVFTRVIDKFFDGHPDPKTLDLITAH